MLPALLKLKLDWNEASKFSFGLKTPRVFGPAIFIPLLSAIARSLACKSSPIAVSNSLKPPLITIAAFTPLAAHSSIAAMVCWAGITTMAKSTSSGMAPIDGYALRPNTSDKSGFTGYILPLNPASSRFDRHMNPTFIGLAEAPIMATVLG
ncbi:hypothetical protein ES703_89242 [subsurface metagenome]